MDEHGPPKPRVEGWLTRGKVMALLGVSRTTVKRMEARGTLKPVILDGVRFFDPKEVERLKSKTPEKAPTANDPAIRPFTRQDPPGKVAAICFQLFAKGWEVLDVVRQLELTPALAQALYEQWWSGNDPTPSPPRRPEPSRSRPRPNDDREQEAADEHWRNEHERIYSAWEKEMAQKWPAKRATGKGPPGDRRR